jgi:hypothetical protein
MIFDKDKLVKAGKMYEFGEGSGVSGGSFDTFKPKLMMFTRDK